MLAASVEDVKKSKTFFAFKSSTEAASINTSVRPSSEQVSKSSESESKPFNMPVNTALQLSSHLPLVALGSISKQGDATDGVNPVQPLNPSCAGCVQERHPDLHQPRRQAALQFLKP